MKLNIVNGLEVILKEKLYLLVKLKISQLMKNIHLKCIINTKNQSLIHALASSRVRKASIRRDLVSSHAVSLSVTYS